MGHKMNVITQYGDSNLLGPNPDETSLNKQVTETLIINMKQEDLEILLRDIKEDEREIAKEVNEIRVSRKREGKRAKVRNRASSVGGTFGVNTFEKISKEVEKAKNPKRIQEFLKAYDKRFRVPRKVTQQFKPLKRELEMVLEDIYNVVELAGLAHRMNIEIPDQVKYKDLSRMIVNKVLLYVSLITGKSKTMYGGAIIDTEPYHELLKYTSFAFITGDPGLSPDRVSELRDVARRGKAMIGEGFSLREKKKKTPFRRKGATLGAVVGGLGLGAAGLLTGGLGLGAAGLLGGALQGGMAGLGLGQIPSAIREQIESSRRGRLEKSISQKAVFANNNVTNMEELLKQFGVEKEKDLPQDIKDQLSKKNKNMDFVKNQMKQDFNISYGKDGSMNPEDYQKLRDIGQQYGIRNKRMSPDKLAREIEIKRESARKDAEKIENKLKRARDRGKAANPKLTSKLSALNKLIGDKVLPLEGNKIPYAYYKHPNNEGIIKDKDGRTVPVYVANQIKMVEMSHIIDSDMMAERFEHALPVYVVNQISGSSSSDLDESDTAATLSDIDKKDVAKFGLDTFRKSSAKGYEYNKPSGIFKGLTGKDPFVAVVDNTLQATNINGAMAIRVFDQSNIIAAQQAEKIEKRKNSKLKNNKAKNILSDEAVALGIRMVRKEPASPVYVVNKMQDVTTRTDLKMDKLEELANKAAKLALDGTLGPVLGGIVSKLVLPGLASGGTGNAAAPIRSNSLSANAGSAGFMRFAQGTKARSSATPMSQFIAGDSLNGKPNEEQVSIDWERKQFQVKPVPSVDRESLANSGISQVKKMSETERGKPMSVGISTHTVLYTRDLKYVRDQGTKEAIKVMPVTPGIDDEIEYNGNKFSLIGLVAQMSAQLADITGLLETGNTQRNAVIANTSAINQTMTSNANQNKSGGNPFLEGGFPTNLNDILKGQ
jgi:hypothetical protein